MYESAPVFCLEIRVFLHTYLWGNCPYTFLVRQSHFRQLSQKSFEQRKEMTFDCGLANIMVAVVCG